MILAVAVVVVVVSRLIWRVRRPTTLGPVVAHDVVPLFNGSATVQLLFDLEDDLRGLEAWM